MTNYDKLITLPAHDLAKIINHIWYLGDLGEIEDVLAEHDDKTGIPFFGDNWIEDWLNAEYHELPEGGTKND